MIDKLEKYFFDTFGIEPREFKSCFINSFCYEGQSCNGSCPHYKTYKIDYPEITSDILLKLICIALQQYCTYSGSINTKNIKKKTLRILLRHKNYLKEIYTYKGSHNSFVKKVRAVFKEGE